MSKRRVIARKGTRVVFHLPLSQRQQEGIVMDLVGWLSELQREAGIIEGCMHSEPSPPIFTAYTWDDPASCFRRQPSVMFIVDFHHSCTPRPLLSELRNRLRAAYAKVPPGATELGIVEQEVDRL